MERENMNELAIAPVPARLPSAAEWAAVMEIVRTAGASDENLDGFTHWDGMYHWSAEPWKQDNWYGVQRPRDGANARAGYPRDTRTAAVGFRPVFDACGMAPRTPDGARTPVGTLYMDGEPVCVDASNVESYRPGAELVFRPVMSDPAYVIHAVKAGDVLVADRVVLKNVSWDDLAAQGFAGTTDGGASGRECANMRAASDGLGDVDATVLAGLSVAVFRTREYGTFGISGEPENMEKIKSFIKSRWPRWELACRDKTGVSPVNGALDAVRDMRELLDDPGIRLVTDCCVIDLDGK